VTPENEVVVADFRIGLAKKRTDIHIKLFRWHFIAEKE
jgi:hypothetical protein